MNAWISFGLRTSAVLSVLAAAKFESLPLGLLPMAFVFLYAFLVWWANRQDPSKLDPHADQVYFLGYLSTLAALGGVVLTIWASGGLDEPRKLLLMVAVALLATVAGIFAMTFLKDLASNAREKSGVTDSQLEDHVLRVLKGIPAGGFAPSAPPEVSQEFIDATEKIRTLIAGVNEELDKLKVHISVLGSRAQEGAAGAQRFSDGVTQLGQVLGDFVRVVGTLFPEAQEQAKKL